LEGVCVSVSSVVLLKGHPHILFFLTQAMRIFWYRHVKSLCHWGKALRLILPLS